MSQIHPMSPAELERAMREDRADLEDARHEQRVIAIGICAIFIGYMSSRYAAKRRKEIMNGFTTAGALPPRSR